jgi:hypothetical protein
VWLPCLGHASSCAAAARGTAVLAALSALLATTSIGINSPHTGSSVPCNTCKAEAHKEWVSPGQQPVASLFLAS